MPILADDVAARWQEAAVQLVDLLPSVRLLTEMALVGPDVTFVFARVVGNAVGVEEEMVVGGSFAAGAFAVGSCVLLGELMLVDNMALGCVAVRVSDGGCHSSCAATAAVVR